MIHNREWQPNKSGNSRIPGAFGARHFLQIR